jgi:hypothetical protein
MVKAQFGNSEVIKAFLISKAEHSVIEKAISIVPS